MKPFVIDEEKHLEETLEHIRENISEYEVRVDKVRQETDDMNDRITPRDRELNSQMSQQLTIAVAMLEHTESMLKKNRLGLEKPYFGRIDYLEEATGRKACLYVGKNGLQYKDETMVVDWRAPAAKIYYEDEIGPCSFIVPAEDGSEDVKSIDIDLALKRTYDIEKGKLLGYYDSDIAANDELLVKYLAQHKDVVLGDIIATIQQEQDRIIRQNPYRNTIVQGVAGSGKTTVALHKISHILYNYSKRYTGDDFLIIGSSDMLLSYIVSGLPDLDVDHVSQARMDEFFKDLLDEDYKKGYHMTQPDEKASFKCRLDFAMELDKYLSKWWHKVLRPRSVEDEKLGEILTREQLFDLLNYRKDQSVTRLEKMLNDTLQRRIRFLTESLPGDDNHAYLVKLRKEKLKQYLDYYRMTKEMLSVMDLYRQFLMLYASEKGLDASSTMKRLKEGKLDVYDMAAMALIRRYVSAPEPYESYGQIIVDEAQDFGEMIYFILRKLQPGAYFTIMGDVSQNINYETGMNDWQMLVEKVFNTDKDEFRTLSKSYRNTIEISEYAGRVLEKAAGSAYKIEPVIRHGREVEEKILKTQEMIPYTLEKIRQAVRDGHISVAVVCRDALQAEYVEESLRQLDMDLMDSEEAKVMVLPIQLVKGLEFDCVVIYGADEKNYPSDKKSAKLLYVAITRSLHELTLISDTKITALVDP